MNHSPVSNSCACTVLQCCSLYRTPSKISIPKQTAFKQLEIEWFGGDLPVIFTNTAEFLLEQKKITAVSPSYALAVNNSY